MTDFPVGEPPIKGLRVWAPDGLQKHGLNNIDLPPQSGGTIIYQDDDGTTFGIKWDRGATTVHVISDFAKKLICIGKHKTLDDYLNQGRKT